MTAIKLAWLELRRFRGPLRKAVPLLLIMIPLLYGSMYLWANWDPYSKTKEIPVAVVNQDHLAHSKEGQRVDAGNQIVQQLKAAQTFDWHFVDAQEAHNGLEHGRYFFTITIPPDFSSKLATAANTLPEQAGITIALNDANNYIAGIMTEVVQPKLQSQVNSAAHAAYVRSIYGELSDIREKLTTASNGGHRLVGATQVQQEGSATLASSTGTMHDGAGQVAGGARQISQAVSQLDTMSGKLTNALAEQIPGATATLVNAASLAANGLETVHSGTSQLKHSTTRGVADLNKIADTHPELRGDPAFSRAQQDANELDGAAARVNSQAATAAKDSAQSLQQAKSIQSNTSAMQKQILAVNTPIRLIDSGSHDVATGAGTLTRGLGTLHQGSGTLKTAADQAHSGASDISRTIDDALGKIPPTNPDQVAHASQVLGTPVHIDRTNLNPAGQYGRGLAPFFFGIALWVFGLFAYLLLKPVNLRAIASRVNPFSIAVAGWLPAATLGVAGALVLYAVVDFGLGLDPVHAGLAIALLAVAAGTFVAIDHFLRTTLGVPGDALSLVLLILQLTSSGGLYPMPTTPSFFQILNPLMPMTYLIDGLRVTISGGLTSNLVRDFLVLIGFALTFLALTSLTVRRQRVWTVGRLHPDVTL